MKEMENVNNQLRLTEEKYRTLAEQIPAITYIADIDEAGSVRYVSPQIEQILGFSPEEWLADPQLWSKQLHPDDHARVLAEYKSSCEKGLPFRSEYRCLTYDGRILWCYNNAVLVKDDAGKPLFFQGVVSDITEYKRVTEEIHLFQTVTLAVSEARDLHDALVTVMQKVCVHTGWVYGETWKPNHDGTLLVRDRACYCSMDGFGKFPVSEEFTFSKGVGLPGLVWTIKHPMWAHDITSDLNYLHNPIVRELGLKTGVAFPIIVDDKVVNIIVFYHVKIEKKNEQLIALISKVLLQIVSIIKRIRAEETLRGSEASLANAQRIAHLGSWEWDIITNEMRWSDEIYRIFGLTPQKFGPTHEAFLNTIHPDDRGLVKGSVIKALYGKAPYSIDYRIVLPDSSERIVHEQAEVVFDNAAKAIQMNGTIQDVTNIRKAEKLLRESEERLKSILDNAPAIIYIKDLQGRYTFINKQFEKLFHIKRDEIKGKTPYDCFPKEIADSHLENDRKVFETKVPMQFDEAATHNDGVVHSYISIKFPLFDSMEKVYAVCGISTNITERKQMEGLIQRERDNLQKYLDIAAVMFLVLDTDGKTTLINKKGCGILGCSEREVIGRNWIDNFVPQRIRDEIKILFNKVIHGEIESSEYFESPILAKNGEERTIAWRSAFLKNEKNTTIGILSSGVDISDDKKGDGEKEKNLK
ncbi:MAG TPA: PAS domain S-box protein [Candidatus Wunengus sp. YC60]|uniref:PAS domain S-box protein n=1 Tax=Candidatus Wunengus sp. YC60 TaxID=3367697 RepID=UPI0040269D6B